MIDAEASHLPTQGSPDKDVVQALMMTDVHGQVASELFPNDPEAARIAAHAGYDALEAAMDGTSAGPAGTEATSIHAQVRSRAIGAVAGWKQVRGDLRG
jgi:hypothetical protein